MKFGFDSYLIKIVALAAIYFGAAQFEFLFASTESNVTLIWIPSGIALGALLLFDYRLWPGVALGAFFAAFSTNASISLAVVTTLSSILEALLGNYLLRRVGFRNFSQVRDVASFILLGAGLSPLLSAAVNAVGLGLIEAARWPTFFYTWWIWGMAHAMGIMIVTPLLLAWSKRPHPITHWALPQWLEFGVILLAGVVSSLVAFGYWAITERFHQAFVYLPFTILLWAGLRLGQIGAVTVMTVTNILAALGVVRGFGPLVETTTLNERLFLLWIFMAIASIAALFTGTLTAERQMSEENFDESHVGLMGMIKSALDAIVTIDENQRVVLFNSAAEQMFGYTAADIIGQAHDRLLPQRFRVTHRQYIDRFGQTNATNRSLGHLTPLQALRADGQEFFVEASITKVDVAGQRFYTAILRDVSETLQIQKNLRQSEARYRSVVEDMPGLLCRFQPNGILEYVNEAYARTFNQTPETLIGQSLLSLIPEESRAKVMAGLEALTPESPVITQEYSVLIPGDTLQWQRWTNRALFDTAGQIIGYQAFGLNVTEHKKLELQLSLVHQAIENSLNGFDIIDEDGKFIYANKAYIEMWGYDSAEEIMGTSPVHHCAAPDIPRQIIKQLKETGSCIIEFKAKRKNGSLFDVLMYALLGHNYEGREIYYGTSIDISERKRAEDKHNIIFRRNQALVRALGEIVYDWHPKQGRLDWNGEYERILGYTPETMGHDTKSWTSRVHPDDIERVLYEVDAAGRENRPYNQEYRFLQQDGTYKWMHDQGILFHNVQGELEQIIGIFRDITKRKQAEEALQQSEARYRAIVEDQTELICRSTPDYVLTFVNDAYCRFFGRSPEKLIGQSFLELLPPETRPIKYDNQARLTPENPVLNDEHQEVRWDGRLRWLHWTDHGIFDESGQLIEVQTVGRDITEQKQAHQQIEFQKTLLECELEASLDGILIVSAERKWLYYNQRFVDMWNLPPEVVAAQSNSVALSYIQSMVVKQEIFIADIEYLLDHPTATKRQEIRLKDGRIFDRYSAPIISAANEHYGRLWSFRDITRERQLEAQLLQSQKMDAIGRLAGGIAHDFNNILVPIIGYVELALMELSSEDKLYDDLQRVRAAAERAAGLTRQILAFSRRQVLEMKFVDLNALVKDFQQLLQRLIGEDVELQTFLEPALYGIEADKGQIEQVLLNLVVNARDAMPTGGKLTIETANVYLDETYLEKYTDFQVPGHYTMLSVSDTGQGIDSDTQKLIFEPFFTTKKQGEGTGLGLSIVFGIVKQHNGYIWVYSESDKGTTFKVYLPQAKALNLIPNSAAAEPGSHYGTETILVVEDEEMVRQLVCETLTSHGYKILEAQTPADGLRLASEYKNTIDLLLTDVIMPKMNGKELYQKVIAVQPDIKVLYISGYTDNVIIHHGILDEERHFLQKPFTVQRLTHKVKQVLTSSPTQ
ncbi:MAG: PAS domain S-box protein [Anaerolineae bacterium]|nr:PAS domain S-box protein [Anaerolineae bacterium]